MKLSTDSCYFLEAALGKGFLFFGLCHSEYLTWIETQNVHMCLYALQGRFFYGFGGYLQIEGLGSEDKKKKTQKDKIHINMHIEFLYMGTAQLHLISYMNSTNY